MKSILITGGSGFLGANLFVYLNGKAKVYFTYHTSDQFYSYKYNNIGFKLDIRNKIEVDHLFNTINPQIVIHTAAIANFQRCAVQQEDAWMTNFQGTMNLVQAAERIRARFIYISTDLVFNGKGKLYTEEDIPDPICYYGKTKYEGEKVVQSISSNFCIARTSLIYGISIYGSKSFSEVMGEKIHEKKELRLFTDEYRSPIYILDLCNLISDLVVSQNEIHGIYNICGSDRLSRFEFGLKLCELFGGEKDLIIPINTDDFPFIDNRPKDCSMSNNKIKNVIKFEIKTIEQGLTELLNDFSTKCKK